MRVRDRVTGRQVSVDEAYERFFDGFFNLGRPEDAFSNMVMSSPVQPFVAAGRRMKTRRPAKVAGRPRKFGRTG
jgi:hypothetical protein